MISRPPSLCRSDSFEIECTEIERIVKRVDHTNRIILVDPVVQTFRKQSRLSAIGPLNEALHSIPRNPQWIISCEGFSHTQGQSRGLVAITSGSGYNQ